MTTDSEACVPTRCRRAKVVPVQVAILGALEAHDNAGTPIEIAGARLRALLARLALDPGRPVAATALVDAVWGDRPPVDAANALQTLVSRLRRALGDAGLISQSSAGYRLGVDAADVDAVRFERLAAEGSAALRSGDAHHAAVVLGEGLALWRGPALADVGEFAAVQTARLDDLRLSAAIERAQAELELGHAAGAAAELDALAAEHPLHERLAAQLVTALAVAGRQAEALRAYERIRSRLADELGVDPSSELQAVHLRVLRGELEAIAPVSGAPRTNLKAQLTSFVGREQEVIRVGKALQDGRLVTLVGPGGAGKTRLASEAAARVQAAARDGTWLIELAPVTDGADVAQAVLGALGLRESHVLDRRASRAARDTHERLLDVLMGKQAVLVLDNCEHLIDSVARLAGELLERCPQLRILTTSREPLAIFGEVLLAVPPLGQPAVDVAAGDALDYPAVRLFADRTAAVDPDFTVDASTVATVIEIVRRLDGLPLAIELAAARMRTIPLNDVAARLSDRFRLLTGGSRTALPRHRTLRAVVAWSWDLLTPSERLLVERLSVFPAGVTIDSARSVGADDAIEELLASLIDKSLLQRVGDGSRVRMLETIREYGIERLAERGELAEVRRRHANHFAALLDTAGPHLFSSTQLPWFARLTDERENILAALRFRCDTGDADGALRVAVGLGVFAMMVGDHTEITTWTGDALAVPGATDADLRAIAVAMRAMNAIVSGSSHDDAAAGIRELQKISADLDRVSLDAQPMAGMLRPAAAYFAGEPELAARYLDEGVHSSNSWARAVARMFRASLAENDGDVAAMRVDVEIALAEFRALGERWGTSACLRMVGLIAALDGDLDVAEAAYVEALELTAQLRSREDEAFIYVRLAELAMRRGDSDDARRLILHARRSAEETGSALESVFTLSMLAEIERLAGNPEQARALHAEARRRIAAMQPGHPAHGHARAMVLAISARLSYADGDLEAALRAGAEAYTAAVATKDLPILAAVGVALTDLAIGRGRYELAAQMLGATARLRGAEDATSPAVVPVRAALSAELGEEKYRHFYDLGRTLERDDAIAILRPTD